EPRLGGNHARHKTRRLGFSRGEEAAGEDDVHRLRLANCPRQPLSTAGTRKDAEVRLRLAEPRGLGRDDQVAGHGELATASEAVARNGCDYRRPHGADRVPLVDAPAEVELERSRVR